jgi:hypothetical protein
LFRRLLDLSSYLEVKCTVSNPSKSKAQSIVFRLCIVYISEGRHCSPSLDPNSLAAADTACLVLPDASLGRWVSRARANRRARRTRVNGSALPANLQLRVTATGPRCSERGNPASKRRRPCSVPWWQIKLQGADTICRTRSTMLVSEKL